MKALVAMMRKLCRGLWYSMKHGEDFDYHKVLEPKALRKRRRRHRRRRQANVVPVCTQNA